MRINWNWVQVEDWKRMFRECWGTDVNFNFCCEVNASMIFEWSVGCEWIRRSRGRITVKERCQQPQGILTDIRAVEWKGSRCRKWAHFLHLFVVLYPKEGNDYEEKAVKGNVVWIGRGKERISPSVKFYQNGKTWWIMIKWYMQIYVEDVTSANQAQYWESRTSFGVLGFGKVERQGGGQQHKLSIFSLPEIGSQLWTANAFKIS